MEYGFQKFWWPLILLPLAVSVVANFLTPILVSWFRGTGKTLREKRLSTKVRSLESWTGLLIDGRLVFVAIVYATLTFCFLGAAVVVVQLTLQTADLTALYSRVLSVVFAFSVTVHLYFLRTVLNVAIFATTPVSTLRRLQSSLRSSDGDSVAERAQRLVKRLEAAGLGDEASL